MNKYISYIPAVISFVLILNAYVKNLVTNHTKLIQGFKDHPLFEVGLLAIKLVVLYLTYTFGKSGKTLHAFVTLIVGFIAIGVFAMGSMIKTGVTQQNE
jgi:hypothetical protein